MSGPEGLGLRGVTKRFGGRLVLREVDLRLSPGQPIVVHGANGSGKSTLLRMIAGVSAPTSGTIVGRPRHVGYLPERFTPPPLMRADAYLRHAGRVAGLTTSAATARAAFMHELLDIRPGPDERLGRLSKGNLQKVGIAQAFLAELDLVVLDEPRTGLETTAWPALERLLLESAAAGSVVVTSEHNPTVIEDAANLLLVRDGSVIRTASTRASIEIEAHPTNGRGELALPNATGVTSAAGQDGSVSIRADAAEGDGILLHLLQNGWSVTSVRNLGDHA